MRIGWAGPWNTSSAIAQFGSEIVNELTARGHSVEVLRTETGEALLLPSRTSLVPVHNPGSVVPGGIRHVFDAVVVNVGDHFLYHGNAIPLIREAQTVLVLHDSSIAHLYAGWAASLDVEAAADRVRELYPAEEAGGRFWLPAREMAQRRPMIEWLAGLGCAAVVHARHYEHRVRAACPGPVEVIPLALNFPGLPPPPEQRSTLTVATIGHVNPNKQAEQVLRAIAAPELRGKVRYRLIGAADEPERNRL
ncbi:MAG: hypothetical protein JO122_21090, partial [Acetobacteraceae bacterium]|nr:hypothetical protein [Acetobacteraceae bacterium]